MSSQTSIIDPPLNPIALEADRIMGQGFLNRKGRLQDLFVYLVSQSTHEQTPSEIMIAADVFGKTQFSDAGDDATVRVYIHRLRGRLSDYYRQHPSTEHPNLSLPKGEYRLILTSSAHALKGAELASANAAQGSGRIWLYAAAGLVALNLLAWGVFLSLEAEEQDLHPIWAAYAQSTTPTLIVVGDYYIYQPAPFDDAPQQLIRDFAINSAQDLEAAQLSRPEAYKGTQDIDLYYLPVSTAYALTKLSPLLTQAISGANARPIKLIQASDVTVSTLKDYNVVYIGFLSGLNYLSRPAFADSNFVNGSSYDQIFDIESGITYDSSEIKSVAQNTHYLDYGYISQFEGPGGNLITIIAGTRDTGLQGVSDILASPVSLGANEHNFKKASRYEALYEVRGEDRENLKQTLVVDYSHE